MPYFAQINMREKKECSELYVSKCISVRTVEVITSMGRHNTLISLAHDGICEKIQSKASTGIFFRFLPLSHQFFLHDEDPGSRISLCRNCFLIF